MVLTSVLTQQKYRIPTSADYVIVSQQRHSRCEPCVQERQSTEETHTLCSVLSQPPVTEGYSTGPYSPLELKALQLEYFTIKNWQMAGLERCFSD